MNRKTDLLFLNNNNGYQPTLNISINKYDNIKFNFNKAKPIRNISDVEGLRIAYNKPSGAYIYGDTLYLSGTRNIRDVYDDLKIPFNMVHQSQKYKDTETLLNSTPGISNIIAHSLGGSVAQKNKDNYPDRNCNITTYGSPNLSISDKTPIGTLRYKNIGDPISSFDRGAKIIGSSLNPFQAHSYENSPYISGDAGGWIVGDTSINTPWDPETSIYDTTYNTRKYLKFNLV